MIQLTVLLGLLGVGVVALVVGHVRRSRRGSARATPGHLRNVGGRDPHYMRLHHRAAAELASRSIRPADDRVVHALRGARRK